MLPYYITTLFLPIWNAKPCRFCLWELPPLRVVEADISQLMSQRRGKDLILFLLAPINSPSASLYIAIFGFKPGCIFHISWTIIQPCHMVQSLLTIIQCLGRYDLKHTFTRFTLTNLPESWEAYPTSCNC